MSLPTPAEARRALRAAQLSAALARGAHEAEIRTLEERISALRSTMAADSRLVARAQSMVDLVALPGDIRAALRAERHPDKPPFGRRDLVRTSLLRRELARDGDYSRAGGWTGYGRELRALLLEIEPEVTP